MNSNVLKKRVMRRVYVIYAIRRVLSPLAMKAYVLGVSFIGLASLVSVGNVLSNMPADFSGALNFILYAFSHTEFIVQLLVFALFVAVVWFARDMVRGLHVTPHLERI